LLGTINCIDNTSTTIIDGTRIQQTVLRWEWKFSLSQRWH